MKGSSAKRSWLAGCVALLLAAPVAGQWYGANTANVLNRRVHTPDLAALTKRFLTPQGFMDPAFPPTVAKPSPYLGDFFGAQAIQDIDRVTILRDLVPAAAEKVAEDEASVTLRFPEGYTARFFPQSALQFRDVIAPVSHVEISGDTWQALRQNIAHFVATLRARGLERRYLVPNPWFRDESIVAQQMASGRRAAVTVDPALQRFRASRDGVLLMPEALHGAAPDVTAATELVGTGAVAWIGMEMIDTGHAKDLARFNGTRAGTPAHVAARQALVDYFAQAWNGRTGPRTTGEENLYFKLVDAAHRHGVQVVALERSTLPFLFFRFGETSFGAGVRSYWWAQAVPARGRGMIFGGSAHMTDAQPVAVQDFVARRFPGRPIFAVKPIVRESRT